MTQPKPDKLYYVRIPKGLGARAEMTRMLYVLAGKPYEDVLMSFAEAGQAVAGKNPYKQFPFIETPDGRCISQTLAIMHHAGRGTSAWPGDPDALTRALAVALGGYDLYQAFGGFAADDQVAKKKFEEKRVPQFFGALGAYYAEKPYAAGDVPTFADCIVHQAIAWCARRNDIARAALEEQKSLVDFRARFEAIPAIRDFMQRQAAAREKDDSV